MKYTRRGGFTVLEAVIVTALAAIFMVLLFPPMLDGLIMTLREQTRLRMYSTADRAMNQITTALRPAILPMVTDPNASGVAATTNGDGNKELHKVLNSRSEGFGANGRAWRTLFAAGTDFLPFAVPVGYNDDQKRLDTNLLPVLGVVMPDGNRVLAAKYTEEDDGAKFFLDGNIHPALAALKPEDFGLDAVAGVPNPNPFTNASYAQQLTFPADSDSGYAVLHFVPELEDGAPRVLSEAALRFDFNDDGTRNDSFVIGAIYLTYATKTGQTVRQTPLTPPVVLLQQNTDADSYMPLFQMVGGFSGNGNDASPSGANWDGSTDNDENNYTILVRMLLFDEQGQRSPFAFMRGGRSYLSYRFETMVTLRSMSRR